MKTKHAAIAAVAACTILSGTAIGGISDFLINNTRGDLYQVDGQTLEATAISVFGESNSLNDIMYEQGTSILYNNGNAIIRHDYSNQQETVLIDTTSGIENFFRSEGLARAENGNIFYTVTSIPNGSLQSSAIVGNLTTQEISAVELSEWTGYIDHHRIGEGMYISADYSNSQIHIINAETGAIEDRFATVDPIVSFFESSSGIFAMTQFGELYSLDLNAQSLSLIGQINGTDGNLIGATIPAPSSALPVAIGILAIRRRRS